MVQLLVDRVISGCIRSNLFLLDACPDLSPSLYLHSLSFNLSPVPFLASNMGTRTNTELHLLK